MINKSLSLSDNSYKFMRLRKEESPEIWQEPGARSNEVSQSDLGIISVVLPRFFVDRLAIWSTHCRPTVSDSSEQPRRGKTQSRNLFRLRRLPVVELLVASSFGHICRVEHKCSGVQAL